MQNSKVIYTILKKGKALLKNNLFTGKNAEIKCFSSKKQCQKHIDDNIVSECEIIPIFLLDEFEREELEEVK